VISTIYKKTVGAHSQKEDIESSPQPTTHSINPQFNQQSRQLPTNTTSQQTTKDHTLNKPNSPANMPIEIHPMTEADVPAHVDIMWASFGPDLMSVFFPNGMSAADRSHMAADTLKSMRKDKPTEKLLFLKAIDTDLPAESQIVATAKWLIYPQERTEEQLDKDENEGSRDDLFSEGANKEAMISFFTELARERRERFGGRPYVLLSILAVSPEHQRRGLGAKMVQVGLEKADAMGVEAYLESSPKGKGLYAKYGFEDKGEMKFDARDYGAERNVVHTLMVRPAKAKGA